MINMRRQLPDNLEYGLPILSSLLLILPFINYRLSPVVFVAIIPYLAFLKTELGKSKPRLILTTWLMGLFTMLFVVGWFVAADTEGWLQIKGPVLQVSIFAVWLLLGLTLSVGFAFLGLVLKYFYKRISFLKLSILVLPSAWIISEFIRSCLVSAMFFGKGASFGPFWNFGSLGLAATATPLGFISRLGGLYGMSAVVIVVNVCIFWLFQKKYRFNAITLLVILLLALVCRSMWQGNARSVRTGTVQLASGSNYYYEDLAGKLKSSRQGSDQPLDVLVLPEYSFFFENSTPGQRQKILSAAFSENHGLLIYTTKGPPRSGLPTNEIIVADQSGQIISRQQKTFLIPTGEYLPWVVSSSLKLFHQKKLVDYFNQNIAVAKSPTPEHPVHANGQTLGVLACSGVVTLSRYRGLANNGADVLINTASLNQFRNAGWYHQQARQFARFQAIANNRPFIQSARGGYSFIIDRNGKFVVDFAKPGLQIGSTTVKTSKLKTPYTILGEWTLIVAVVVLLSLGIEIRTPVKDVTDKKKNKLKLQSDSK